MPYITTLITLFLMSSSAMAAKTVTVTIEPDGQFPYRVISTPAGIDCPGTCTVKFRGSDDVVLEGEPLFPLQGSFFFLSWSGYCVDNSPTCTLDGNGQFSVTAEIPEEPLVGIFSSGAVLSPDDPSWPVPRYSDPSIVNPGEAEGLIWDYLTGIRWMKNANCISQEYLNLGLGTLDGEVSWIEAQQFISDLNSRAILACGFLVEDPCLSSPGEWAIPSKDQLESLIDERFFHPMISNRQGDAATAPGDPFTNNWGHRYWSSTPRAVVEGVPPDSMWVVDTSDGLLYHFPTASGSVAAVWPVCVDSPNP